jgi:hypothetical protein
MNAFSPIQFVHAIIILSLSKKNKEEGNSLVGYRRYCYTTELRDVCNLIIITCAYDERISREREFPSYLISINSLSATHCPFSLKLLRPFLPFFSHVVSRLRKLINLRSHDCNFRSPLMKTLDWSVETLGLDYNSTGLYNHLFKPE